MAKKDLLKKLGEEKLTKMFESMVEIRTFEEKVQFLFLEGKMPGTIHQYIGMEACAVGVCFALKEGDVIGSTHRPHGHAIARGIPSKEIMAELYGKTTGCCKGKGGSMHIGDIKRGMLPAIAIVGGNIPIVMGMALAFKLKNQKRVAVSFFGDGASNEGAFHEALNMASIYDVPAVFICENNLYGASTSIKKTLKIENISERASSYGKRGMIADGMNVIDVYEKASKAVGDARSGRGPTLLELKTFRFCGHSRRDPSKYIPKEEKELWKKKDPILNLEKILLEEKVINEEGTKELKDRIDKKIEEAIEFGQNSPEPRPEDTYNDLYVSMEVPR